MRNMQQTGRPLVLTDAPRHRSHRAAKVLAHLPEHDPALATLAIWCEIVDAEGADTFIAADTIRIGSTFVQMPLREQIGVLSHHVMHIALRHEYRMQELKARYGDSFDPVLHNLCSDSILNECLTRGGHALPRPAPLLSDLLRQADLPGVDPAQDLLRAWDADRLYLALRRAHVNVATLMDDTAFRPDIYPNDAPLKADRHAGAWRAHLIRAARSAGSMGRGIGHLLRHIADTRPGQTPWEQRLRGLLAKALSHEPKRTYRRPRSAWIAADALARQTGGPDPAFEPGLLRHALRPRLVVALDASGSVDQETLALFSGEVISLSHKSGAETHLMCFDEAVFAHKKLSALTARSAFAGLPLHRDGGTSFIDVLAQADALDPSLIVVLTDLLGAFGPKPKAPVLWASPVGVATPPPFGAVLELTR